MPITLAAMQLAVAGMTSWIAYAQFDDSSDLTNVLRIAIIALMVVTAFILIRWDVQRKP